jgi:hypothetical protein
MDDVMMHRFATRCIVADEGEKEFIRLCGDSEHALDIYRQAARNYSEKFKPKRGISDDR